MSIQKGLLLASAIACMGTPGLAEDKYDSSHPPVDTPRGKSMESHQDFGYRPSKTIHPLPARPYTGSGASDIPTPYAGPGAYAAPGYYVPGHHPTGPYGPGPYVPGHYPTGPYAPGSYAPGPYAPGPYAPGPYVPQPDRRVVPTVDYYHPYSYYPSYNAPYHVAGSASPYPEPHLHSPYPFESQGGILDNGYYPGRVTYYVGNRDWGSFFRTNTDAPNYPGPKKDIVY